MSFKLLLSPKSRPWNAVYSTEDGEPVYRAVGKSSEPDIITVSRIREKNINNSLKSHSTRFLGSSAALSLEHKDFAVIRLRNFHPDEITMNGVTMKDKNLFTKTGAGWYGRDRVWNGPDGQEYRWVMGDSKPELFRNDKQKTPIAKFHREHSGFMGLRDKTQASLEIFSQVSEPLLEMILVTFMYMEATRAAREKAVYEVAGEVGSAAGG